jgi:hypothetical protein
MRVERGHPCEYLSAGWVHGTKYAHWESDPFTAMPFFGSECDQESLCFAEGSPLTGPGKKRAFLEGI